MDAASFLRRLIDRGPPARPARAALELCEALLSERGEASGAALARDALAAIGALDDAGRADLFDALASDYAPSPDAVLRAAELYRMAPEARNLRSLQEAVEPPRQELFRRLNMAPGGTRALVGLRAQLLAGLAKHREWRAVDADLTHLFRSWFNRGFLVLERIDWRTPALVLEKIIAYESVHEIRGWDDLRRRLAADRRCFAFFHPALPHEPLVFIEVALVRGLPARIQPLIEVGAALGDPARADCALFYSINSCHDGLRGISFGSFLIKQVAEDLRRELPRLRRFATLSPIPGLRAWLDTQRAEHPWLERLDAPRWHEAAPPEFARQMLALCARYLVDEKRGAEPRDAVARFHLGNGARLERLNWLADVSKHGLRQSAGLMANYVYRLDEIERNHERFVKEHAVAASRSVLKLAREGARQP